MSTHLKPGDHRTLIVDTYHDPRALPALGWDEMVRAEGAPVFYRSDYLTAYHDSPLALVDRFGYMVIRDGSSPESPPVALLPVALHRRPDPLGLLRLAHPGIEAEPALLSHVWHCYDTRIVGAVRRPEVVRAALDTLRSLAASWGARWYGMVGVARGGATAEALATAGLTGTHLVDRFTADLTGVADLESYLGRLRRPGRANLRRNARRAAETGFTIAVVTPAAADLTEIAELCAR
ncbi:MAG: hypothetical protein L0Y54_14305, partial [Sporichthyaceae bacterium]|nr:hypothetical protein [Sporichthyaceae bacterium]